MPYVSVPKDLSKIKTKVALNLTKRQLICFSTAAVVGIPTYLFSRQFVGSEGAVFLMIGVMLPFFLIAMYEKDDQPAEKVLRNIIRTRFIWPSIRTYKTDNLYRNLREEVRKIGVPQNKNKTRKNTRKPPIRRKSSIKKK